jgi:hypothetical protein
MPIPILPRCGINEQIFGAEEQRHYPKKSCQFFRTVIDDQGRFQRQGIAACCKAAGGVFCMISNPLSRACEAALFHPEARNANERPSSAGKPSLLIVKISSNPSSRRRGVGLLALGEITDQLLRLCALLAFALMPRGWPNALGPRCAKGYPSSFNPTLSIGRYCVDFGMNCQEIGAFQQACAVWRT